MLTERFPELSHAWTAFPVADAEKQQAGCAGEHQLMPSTLQAHFKDLAYLIVFIWCLQDDKLP